MIKVNSKNYDCQRSVGYIIYMMAGSIFHKCACRSLLVETQNYLHFVEMPEAKKESFEDSVLRALDDLNQDFRDAVANLNCEARFIKDGNLYYIHFWTGGFETIEAVVDPDGCFEIKALPA